MKYTVVKNNKFTGVTYDELSERILAHHASQGELVIPVEEPPTPITENNGMPVFGEVTLEDLKRGKILELDSAFRSKLGEGFKTSSGVTLSTAAEDYRFYAVSRERAKAKLEKGKPGTAVVTVRDRDGSVLRDVPARDYISMVEELEEYLESLWYRKAELEEQVKKATSADELAAIEW